MNSDSNTKKTVASAIQQQFWVLNNLNPDSPAYNVASIFKIQGSLNIDKLEKSINLLVEHYDILRSTFTLENNSLFQVINHFTPVRIIVDNYEGLKDSNVIIKQAIKNESALPFDLENGPLFRCKILRLNAAEYFLILTMHHIITDLRSNDIFGEQLSTIYNSEYDDIRKINNETITYAKFSETQKELLNSAKYQEKLEFFKNLFSDTEELLNLPLDHKRPKYKTFTGNSLTFEIPTDSVKKIRELCQDPSLNSFIVLLSAYIGFLHKYSGQDRIIVGVPYANRRKNEVKNTMGSFVNMLPISVTLSNTKTFTELLDLTRKAVLDVHSRQEVPLEQIVKILGIHSDASHNPIYQCGFTFRHPMSLSLKGLKVEPFFYHQGGSQLDLLSYIWDTGTSIQCLWEYDSDIIDVQTAERMTEHFLNFINSACDAPLTLVTKLSMLSEKEYRTLTYEFNNTQADLHFETTLHSLFEEQVLRTPEAPALQYENTVLSYKQLDNWSNVIAQSLIKLGTKRGSIVGICAERSLELVAGLMGILKAGAAYLPIDPGYPASRVSYILNEARPAVMVTQYKFLQTLDLQATQPVLLLESSFTDDNIDIIKTQPTETVTPDDLAYVIYTSGSTGTPKGVMIPHRGICNRLIWMQNEFNLSDKDKILQKTPFTFDVSVWEFFWPLITGAKLVVARPGGHQDAAYIANIIQDAGITIVHFVPPMLGIFMEETEATFCKTLRYVICSGEALTYAHQLRFFERMPITTRLYNLYGPTEASVDVSVWECKRTDKRPIVPIGAPISNTQLYVLDNLLQPVPIGVPGELHIGGVGLARGYLNRSDLTSNKFIPSPFIQTHPGMGSSLYKTGDLARWLDDGVIEFLGRLDFQVKIRGFRIELGEIESVIANTPFVEQCVTIVRSDITNDKHIVAYVIPAKNKKSELELLADIRSTVTAHLPAYMHPSFYVCLDTFPLSTSGKVDRKALPKPKTETSHEQVLYSQEENRIAALWEELLEQKNIPVDLKFFEAGGTSLLAARLAAALKKMYDQKVTVALVFQHPTIRELAQVLSGRKPDIVVAHQHKKPENLQTNKDVAIVGMSCRLPGASSIEEYWQLLSEGREGISFFCKNDVPSDIDTTIKDNDLYICAKGMVSNPEFFDASFFGIQQKVAEVMDPQIRLFIETAYNALEDAGYTPDGQNGRVGVFAGMGRSLYLRNNILTRPDIIDQVGELQIDLGNEKDFLATRLSHLLNLKGPSINVSTACSTSLVATIMACQALQRGDCELALAGGCEITIPVYRGHLHQEGAIFSRDGHCRPFDADATGTVFSDGAGVVILKKLSDAIADNNNIYAVIKGGAINNDGSKKVSYTAPGVDGQVDVILSAQKLSNVPAETISYIETHGTATPLGDPIEIESLNQAFSKSTHKKQFCAIGSAKSNIGHTGVAAGIAGFIKTVLMLHHKTLVPSINFSKPNPAIDFESSPFYVNTKHSLWETGSQPRRAGVSSFGFGGTNAHIILEEAPLPEKSGPSRDCQLLLFSAKSSGALESMIRNTGTFLDKNNHVNLADCAFTLKTGRESFSYRKMITGRSHKEISEKISQMSHPFPIVTVDTTKKPSLVFMFPGQGNQYIGMGQQLYKKEATFREAFDTCAASLQKVMGEDIKKILFAETSEAAQERLRNTFYAQTTIFAIEYALANLWMSWGLKPDVLIGHSIGEFAAACISGIMHIEDAATLVAVRARLMSELPSGTMISVRLSEDEILPMLGNEMSLAAVNSPSLCVVSGPQNASEKFIKECGKKEIICRPLHTSHAFHSSMMEPAIPMFEKEICKIKLSAPKIPVISTVTGCLLTDKEALDPQYWARHMRVTVRFSNAVQHILSTEGKTIFLEVGPRATSTVLARQQIKDQKRQVAMASLGESGEIEDEAEELINTAGLLWEHGLHLDWNLFYKDEKRNLVSLPPYPYNRKRYWIEPAVRCTSTDNLNVISEITPAACVDNCLVETTSAAVSSDNVTHTLVSMVASALGCTVDTIDTQSTFLQLGMDSLFLTQLAQRLKSNFGIQVSMRQLMRNLNTIEKLALHINSNT